jgi:hypothetical protein
VLANSRTRPGAARRAVVAVAVPAAATAALLCTAALAGPAFAAGTTATPTSQCSSTAPAGTATSATPKPSASTATPNPTATPSAGNAPLAAPSTAATTPAAGSTGAPTTAPATPPPSPTATPTATASSGGFWGWLNGVWQWIFSDDQLSQSQSSSQPVAAEAAPLQAVPLNAAAADTKNVATPAPAISVPKPVKSVLGLLPTAPPTKPATTLAKVGSTLTGTAAGTDCTATSVPLKRDDASGTGNSAAIIPWHLSTPSMTMYGLTFNGVTTVQTTQGSEQVLDFTASRVEIESMVTYSYPGGSSGLRQYNNAGSGTTTVLTNVHLWTTTMTADVYGLIQVTLTPTSTPTELLKIAQGFTIPIPVVFTDVNADNAFMSAGNLSIPGFDGFAGS